MNKKMTNRKIKYIKRHYKEKSDRELAQKLGVPRGLVKRVRKELNLGGKEERFARPPLESKPSPVRSTTGKWSRRKIVAVSLLVGVVVVGLGLYLLSRVGGFRFFSRVDRSKLNVILITIDTLRADHVECYGYNKIKTPELNRMAEEGVRFAQVVAPVPLTLPSHTSIMTGTYPLFHLVRDNGGYYVEEDYITLAEVLKERGFATGAFIGAFVLDSKWGLNQGFDYYYDNFDLSRYRKISLSTVQRPGDEVEKEAMEWIASNGEGKFFAWIHFFDPHSPYTPPAPFDTLYPGRPYDGEIAYVDMLIGRLREFLVERDLLDKTLLVITSDHGEGLGEHRELLHGNFVYDTTLLVPLIIRFPKMEIENLTIAEQVRLIDIMPTILDYLGVPPPPESQGVSLMPKTRKKNQKLKLPAYGESYYTRIHFGWSELKCIRTERYKFIDAPKPELYDIKEDPAESKNLYQERKPIGDRLQKELAQIIESHSVKGEKRAPAEIDAETERKLRALGYTTSIAAPFKSDKEGRPLADPKDKVEVIRLMNKAEKESDQENTEEAIKTLEEVVSLDPNIVDAYVMLGNMFTRRNLYQRAVADYRRAIELNPDYDLPKINLAIAYKEWERYEEAAAILKEVVSRQPRNSRANFYLGDVYRRQGMYDEAIKYYQQGVEHDPNSATLNAELGLGYYYQGLLSKAEQSLRRALERNPSIYTAHFALALIYEKKGDFDSAIEEYKKEIENNPQGFKAYFNLGIIYGKRGDYTRQIELIKKSVELNSKFSEGYFYLAKAYLDTRDEKNFQDAIEAANRGLQLDPNSPYAPLGHYVLVDIYNRQGKSEQARFHLQKARELEKRGATPQGSRK
ncbi:hypothetical protein CEE39_04750 [bacterium (candidate division B38) B3_B38]|nr:MAG: hypothetical protein CEE39_04750 [bacterium (candidate division B38) B3_B38]